MLKRNRAAAIPLVVTFGKINEIVRGWIDYYHIGSMKEFLDEFGQWLRHKIRGIILKQWKKPKTIYKNLMKLNKMFKCNMVDKDIFKVANSRLGWYARSTGNVVNFLIAPKVLQKATKDWPGLIAPLTYYHSKLAATSVVT